MGVYIVGFQFDRVAVIFGGFVKVASHFQREAKVVEYFRLREIQGNGGFVVLNGFIKFAKSE